MIWPTLLFGLSEVGVSQESARSLGAWYTFKLRSVWNKPRSFDPHHSSDLFEEFSLEDPVDKLVRLQRNRFSKLHASQNLGPDIACEEGAVLRSQSISSVLSSHREDPVPTSESAVPTFNCQLPDI